MLRYRTGVRYTNIETRYDEVVTPPTPFDHVALRDVLNALDPAHAAAVTCGPVLPVLGG